MRKAGGAVTMPGKQRVFVVDDEDVIAQTLAIILRHSGFDASSFTNPLQALAAARDECPDLVISDVMMPEMSGVDLAIALQRLCPGCKILLFSGQSSTQDLLGTARSNGHHFQLLSKPIHPTDLLAAIRGLPGASVDTLT
jgi:DNA-binding response OmpR family regulator